ncbi:MAG: mechanosensitive ion channel [Bacteroidetes bacterium]|nr:MAG: mechanosensitive ion channel [Bacteroidota bacterium]
MEEFLNYNLFRFRDYSLSVYHLVALGILILVTWTILYILRKAIFRSRRMDPGRKYALYQIIRYVSLVIAIAIGLESLGVKLTVLMAGSAALLVGIGLGLQHLFNDFVSGIILLADASVEVDDVIEVDGIVARVQAINLRTSLVKTRDEKYIILPNSVITGGKLINWTHHKALSRFDIVVGVSYNSNVEEVRDILIDVAQSHPHVSPERVPRARILNFSDSSIDFEVLFWTKEVFGVENTKSDIRFAICKAFREHGVEIPFPQRVVHMPRQNTSD